MFSFPKPVVNAIEDVASALIHDLLRVNRNKAPSPERKRVQRQGPAVRSSQPRSPLGRVIGYGLVRTARLIFDGVVHIPATAWRVPR
ncbi:hypothetical protein [Pseudomonas abietaniphila]|uniref:hypothetical protein n=1 Tax=Pseudomonas abietaniphila TaxID=89065 RepID=UPI00116007CB|nr:hypothetical protein [Pseudomonas abietaniphila]